MFVFYYPQTLKVDYGGVGRYSNGSMDTLVFMHVYWVILIELSYPTDVHT